ncbi:hypothetical protein KR51_00026400 [Rubidibacter lacunae KORDI 51-2]|uniref:Uncharacterized protein n=1 Tax=Rubidibacter lacunae KORDI 51-2 TaxID=582515 RepID=U5DI96_9CHRO|nr:hypothetical protein KR51_00026400 [Rubidibacter lacunae KORDI 51-2]
MSLYWVVEANWSLSDALILSLERSTYKVFVLSDKLGSRSPIGSALDSARAHRMHKGSSIAKAFSNSGKDAAPFYCKHVVVADAIAIPVRNKIFVALFYWRIVMPIAFITNPIF